MRNRIHNATNPYQGDTKKVACVCSAGLLRSPTCAHILHTTYGYNTRALGINSDYALIGVDEVIIHWADEIVFMEQYQEDWFKIQFANQLALKGTPPKLTVLDIEDNFGYMDERLVNLILEKYDAED